MASKRIPLKDGSPQLNRLVTNAKKNARSQSPPPDNKDNQYDEDKHDKQFCNNEYCNIPKLIDEINNKNEIYSLNHFINDIYKLKSLLQGTYNNNEYTKVVDSLRPGFLKMSKDDNIEIEKKHSIEIYKEENIDEKDTISKMLNDNTKNITDYSNKITTDNNLHDTTHSNHSYFNFPLKDTIDFTKLASIDNKITKLTDEYYKKYTVLLNNIDTLTNNYMLFSSKDWLRINNNKYLIPKTMLNEQKNKKNNPLKLIKHVPGKEKVTNLYIKLDSLYEIYEISKGKMESSWASNKFIELIDNCEKSIKSIMMLLYINTKFDLRRCVFIIFCYNFLYLHVNTYKKQNNNSNSPLIKKHFIMKGTKRINLLARMFNVFYIVYLCMYKVMTPPSWFQLDYTIRAQNEMLRKARELRKLIDNKTINIETIKEVIDPKEKKIYNLFDEDYQLIEYILTTPPIAYLHNIDIYDKLPATSRYGSIPKNYTFIWNYIKNWDSEYISLLKSCIKETNKDEFRNDIINKVKDLKIEQEMEHPYVVDMILGDIKINIETFFNNDLIDPNSLTINLRDHLKKIIIYQDIDETDKNICIKLMGLIFTVCNINIKHKITIDQLLDIVKNIQHMKQYAEYINEFNNRNNELKYPIYIDLMSYTTDEINKVLELKTENNIQTGGNPFEKTDNTIEKLTILTDSVTKKFEYKQKLIKLLDIKNKVENLIDQITIFKNTLSKLDPLEKMPIFTIIDKENIYKKIVNLNYDQVLLYTFIKNGFDKIKTDFDIIDTSKQHGREKSEYFKRFISYINSLK